MPHPADAALPDRLPPQPALSAGPFAGARAVEGWAVELPLNGVTILAVEDSRFTCEALRLMTRRAGARLRRAETIEAARAHLRVYRPDVVLIDLGLPDGRGENLIREVVMSSRRPKAVLGTSGLEDGRGLALAAGADGFIDKPLENLAQLCRVLRPLLPELDILPPLGGATPGTLPDLLALQDDLAFADRALQGEPGPERQRYVRAFLAGIARHSKDEALGRASALGVEEMRKALAARLGQDNGFGSGDRAASSGAFGLSSAKER